MAGEKETQKKGISKRTVSKWKKKRWFKLIAPAEFDRKALGETPAEKPELLKGRTTRINLSDLTSDRKHRHITVIFKVDSVQGDNAYTVTKGHDVEGSYLGRIVRRRRSKVETVQTLNTQDNVKVKLKSVTITSKKVNKNQKREIGRIMRKVVESEADKKSFSQLEQEAVFGVLALKIFKGVKKISPIKRVEIVKSRIVEGK